MLQIPGSSAEFSQRRSLTSHSPKPSKRSHATNPIQSISPSTHSRIDRSLGRQADSFDQQQLAEDQLAAYFEPQQPPAAQKKSDSGWQVSLFETGHEILHDQKTDAEFEKSVEEQIESLSRSLLQQAEETEEDPKETARFTSEVPDLLAEEELEARLRAEDCLKTMQLFEDKPGDGDRLDPLADTLSLANWHPFDFALEDRLDSELSSSHTSILRDFSVDRLLPAKLLRGDPSLQPKTEPTPPNPEPLEVIEEVPDKEVGSSYKKPKHADLDPRAASLLDSIAANRKQVLASLAHLLLSKSLSKRDREDLQNMYTPLTSCSLLLAEQTRTDLARQGPEVRCFSTRESPRGPHPEPAAASRRQAAVSALESLGPAVSLDWLVSHYCALFNLTADLINASQTCTNRLPKLAEFPKTVLDKPRRFEESLQKIDKLLFDKRGRSDQPAALVFAFQKKMEAFTKYDRLFADIKAHIGREAAQQESRKQLLEQLTTDFARIDEFAKKIYRLENLQRSKLQKYGAKPSKGLASSSLL